MPDEQFGVSLGISRESVRNPTHNGVPYARHGYCDVNYRILAAWAINVAFGRVDRKTPRTFSRRLVQMLAPEIGKVLVYLHLNLNTFPRSAPFSHLPCGRSALCSSDRNADREQLMFAHDNARNNCLLAALPEHEFDRIRPTLERVSLTTGLVLHEPGDKFRYVYFPTTAVVTLLYLTESGTTVGLGLIGNEGILGIELFMGVDSDPSMAIVQNAGIAYRMRAGAFRAKCLAASPCRDSLLRYTQALITQVSQTAACNRFHSVQQRFARWLLESSDRLDANRLTMTHEQIASALGVRRESISPAAHNLSVSGIIEVERGRLTILDRPALEFAACECYKAVSAEYNRLLGPTGSRTCGQTGLGLRS